MTRRSVTFSHSNFKFVGCLCRSHQDLDLKEFHYKHPIHQPPAAKSKTGELILVQRSSTGFALRLSVHLYAFCFGPTSYHSSISFGRYPIQPDRLCAKCLCCKAECVYVPLRDASSSSYHRYYLNDTSEIRFTNLTQQSLLTSRKARPHHLLVSFRFLWLGHGDTGHGGKCDQSGKAEGSLQIND